jgi:hypothetical protein
MAPPGKPRSQSETWATHLKLVRDSFLQGSFATAFFKFHLRQFFFLGPLALREEVFDVRDVSRQAVGGQALQEDFSVALPLDARIE